MAPKESVAAVEYSLLQNRRMQLNDESYSAGKGRTPLKWFVKVAASGALGLQELLKLPEQSDGTA